MQSTEALDLVRLTTLMERTSGRAEVVVGLIDGPVAVNHPDLASQNIRQVPGSEGACRRVASAACQHGTFVAGILAGKRGSAAPAICPDCTLLLRPIFSEELTPNTPMPSATPEALAAAIVDTVRAGARIMNVSAALAEPSTKGERSLEEALDHAARKGVLVIAAAGNQGTVGSWAITRHPWVIPVTACDSRGRPTPASNLSHSVGRRGLAAPGQSVTSLGADGRPYSFGGTSAATPFVTGAMALLWSEFPRASAADIKAAVCHSHAAARRTVVPPLLDAWMAYRTLTAAHK